MIRRFSRRFVFFALALLPLIASSCSETPTGRSESPWVAFENAEVDLGSFEVGGETKVGLPITFNFVPRDRSLFFVATDARFRVTPSTWDPKDLLPDELELSFAPTVADDYAAYVQVVSGVEVVGEIYVTAEVWSPWASLQVASGRVDFETMPPGSMSFQSLQIGNSHLAAMPCTLRIVEPERDVSVEPLEAILAPGEWEDFRVELACDGELFRRDDLIIHSNDPYQPHVRVEISGDCQGTPDVSGLPLEIDFRETAVFVGKTLRYRATNSGNGTFIMESHPHAGLTIQPERLVIPPGGSQVLQVGWIPIETGSISSALSFTTNAEGGELRVPVKGTAIPGIVPARSVGGILLEMLPADAARDFGLPDWVWCEPGCGVSWNWDIEDAVLFHGLPDACCTLDESRPAREIAAWNTFPGRTASGLGMGSTLVDVVLEFGDPPVVDDTGPTLWWAYPDEGILFMFVDDRVYLVDVFRPEDWAGGDSLAGPGVAGLRASREWIEARHR